MADKRTEVIPREERYLTRREPMRLGSPFSMLERFADEMDRILDDFGLDRPSPASRTGRSFLRSWQGSSAWSWAPDVEVFHRNDEFVVRADLPGLNKDDVKVDVTENGITIQGERKREHEEEREGFYRSERSYGSFYRMIPLPDGTITDQAKAKFKDGVLEITMPAPPEHVRRGRRLEITGEPQSKK